jgi:transposase
VHPERQITLWFMDEARVGQKGRTGYQWWIKGERPRGLCDQRFESTYIYGAVCPATGDDFALVLPEVSTGTMGLFLDRFAATLAPNTQAVLVLDRAGWHRSRRLRVPENITLVPLPAYSPELNPVERIVPVHGNETPTWSLRGECRGVKLIVPDLSGRPVLVALDDPGAVIAILELDQRAPGGVPRRSRSGVAKAGSPSRSG